MYPTLKVELTTELNKTITWIANGNEVTRWVSAKEYLETGVKQFDTAADAFQYVIDQVIVTRRAVDKVAEFRAVTGTARPEEDFGSGLANEDDPPPFWTPDYHGLARE